MRATPKHIAPGSSRSTDEIAQDSWPKQLAQTDNNSQEATAQRRFLAGIPDSLRMTAQRQRIESYIGSSQSSAVPHPPGQQASQQQNSQRLKNVAQRLPFPKHRNR
jgi:hypothetical protein